MNFKIFRMLCLVLGFTGTVFGMGKKMPHDQFQARKSSWVLAPDITVWLEESPDILGDAMSLLEADLTEPVETLLSKWSSDPLRQDEVKLLARLLGTLSIYQLNGIVQFPNPGKIKKPTKLNRDSDHLNFLWKMVAVPIY